MNTPPNLPYAPPTTTPAKPKSNGRFWLIGCGGALVAALLGIGTCGIAVFGGMAVGEKELGPVCDRYLDEIAAGDYHKAYVEADSALHDSTTEEAFTNIERGIHERTGALRTKSVNAASAGIDGGGRWGRLIYKAEFEKGRGSIRMDLRKRSDGWKVASIHYDSPQLEQSIRELFEKKATDASTGDE